MSQLPLAEIRRLQTVQHISETFFQQLVIIILPSVAYDPVEGWQKLDRLQNTTESAGMTCHLINRAVMKQNCIEALNQHAQPLEKKAAVSSFSWNFGNPSTTTTEKRDSWAVNRAEWFHRSYYYYSSIDSPHSQLPRFRLKTCSVHRYIPCIAVPCTLSSQCCSYLDREPSALCSSDSVNRRLEMNRLL